MDATTKSRYLRLQWRTLIILMLGYVCHSVSYWKAPANGYEKAEVVLREMNLLN